MSSLDQYISAPSAKSASSSRATMSFTSHRAIDVPASAVRAGASSAPKAFASRTAAPAPRRDNDEPLTIPQLVMRPFERLLGAGWRAKAGALALIATALVLIF